MSCCWSFCLQILTRSLPLVSTGDYDASRKLCLEMLGSPSFDCIGKAFHLRQSDLLEHNIAPPNLTHKKQHMGNYKPSMSKRPELRGHREEGDDDEDTYLQSNSDIDDEDEDEEDERLQVPVCNTFCRSNLLPTRLANISNVQ